MSEPPHMPPATVEAPTLPTADERNMAMLCHLLGIIASITIGLGFLGPLIMWLLKKDESAFVDHHGKEALNFQLTTLLVITVTSIAAMILMFILVGIVLIPVIIIIAVFALIAEILACLAAQRGEWHRYPACIRFIS